MDSRFSSQSSAFPSTFTSTSRQSMSSAYSQPHQLPQPSVTPPHTLPPLVPQNYGNPFATDPGGHRSQPLPPSHLPPTSNPSSNGNSYPVYAPTATTHYHGQNPVFPYRPPASESQGYPPYNSSGPSQGFPTLLPMPNSNTQQHQSYPPPTASTPTTSSFEQHPTHVVGSQGRRGILPSAAGRPSAIPNGAPGGSKASTTPTKDNDGKFPCEHCAKTYLHAKHLKRHLLRRGCILFARLLLPLMASRYWCTALFLWALPRYLFSK